MASTNVMERAESALMNNDDKLLRQMRSIAIFH